MSQSLWERVPVGFLKKGYKAWGLLDREVQQLIVELAKDQNFKCAFCGKDHSLVIEHDHEPEQGPGKKYTIHNVRGLVCEKCNWHLGVYEERGEYIGWDHVDPRIHSHEYEDYIYAFECRLQHLHEELVKNTCPNYPRRRLHLGKFDDWKDGWESYPWNWCFEEIKEKRHGKIRTPKQFIRTLTACMKCVLEEVKKDPNYQPPEAFFEVMVRFKPLLDEVRPIVEARLAQSASSG
jgi:Recombination endonuclease VII